MKTPAFRRRPLKRALLVLVMVPGFGCARVSGSAVATGGVASAPLADDAPVRLCALCKPDESRQVGIVQAKGVGDLEELATEFVKQVRRVGGNCGKVDAIRTKFDWVTQAQSYSYNCGSSTAPVTCTGSRMVTVEVATTQVLGRAFKLERP